MAAVALATLAFATGICLCASPSARADLISSLVNGGFEDGTGGVFGFGSSTDVNNANMPGWLGAASYNFGVWFDNGGGIAPTFPTFFGSRAAAMNTGGPNAAGQQAIIYQSLGTVGAQDVGIPLELSAWLGARGFAGRSYEGEMSVFFFSGDPLNPTVLGTPDTLSVVTNPGLVTPAPAFGLLERTATFAPEAGHLGVEIFAGIYTINNTNIPNDENQYVADNVSLAVVPEPSTVVLACLGSATLAIGAVRRRSRK